MSFKSETIKNIIDGINSKAYVLPSIQREFIWRTEQIERLFDSLLRGYPIGSFLFWKINANNTKDYIFYDFIKDYHQKDMRHNPKHINDNKDIISILDGQQRLTSLYIGLNGSYSYKEYKKQWNNPLAFTKRFLYLNIFRDIDNLDFVEEDMLYEFKFLKENEANERDDKHLWFKVGDILNINITDYVFDLNLNDNTKNKYIHKILNDLQNVFTNNNIINYYEERDQDIDKVLTIFTRINSGGTILSYSDLLLSTSTAMWEKYDAREEIYKLTDEINNMGIHITKDFVMKSFLVLSDLDIVFKVKNFKRENMKKIEENWEEIKKAIILTFSFIKECGYKDEFITSYNALLPIVYYLKKIKVEDKFLSSKVYEKDREIIKKWFACSLVKKVFGGSSDTILKQYRSIIRNTNSGNFPIKEIIDKFKNTNRSVSFDDEYINSIIDDSYFGNKKTFSILLIMQYDNIASGVELSVDHIHPQIMFKKNKIKGIIDKNDIDYYKHNICNLQILPKSINSSKGDKPLEDWINSSDAKKFSFLIPQLGDYSINNCIEFFEARRKLLIEKLHEKLSFN